MTATESQQGRLARLAPRLLLGLGIALFFSIRLQVFDDEVPNPDISGILYNADGLLRGELPYVDNAEFKPLGSFYVVAACFATLGRDLLALQWAYTGWLLLGVPAIALALPRKSTSSARALALTVYLVYAGMFTYNYTAWMMPVYAWAFAGIVRSLDGGWRWSIATGVLSALAFAFMQRAGVLGPLGLGLWLIHGRAHGLRWSAPAGWMLGSIGGATLVALPYIARGELGTLLTHVFPISLVSSYGARSGSELGVVLELPYLLVQTFGGAWSLALVGLVLTSRSRLGALGPSALCVLASLIGTGLGGGRFYLHYMPQLLPGLAVLVGATGLGRAIDEAPDSKRRVLAMTATGAVVLGWVFAVATGDAHRYEARARRLSGGQSAAQAAGAHIRAHTGPGDTIYGWGWTAWRVYFWADRRAPGRHYKALGRLTTFNTNTAFVDGGEITFVPGEQADTFIEDFDAHPPTYFVRSPSFTATFGAEHDPLADFTALQERLRHYRLEAQFGDLELWRRQPGL